MKTVNEIIGGTQSLLDVNFIFSHKDHRGTEDTEGRKAFIFLQKKQKRYDLSTKF